MENNKVEIKETERLGDIVTEHPELSKELEALKLDFCCGGKHTLGEACTKAGIDATATARRLTEALAVAPSAVGQPAEATAASWSSLSELCDHIERVHHVPGLKELPRLEALAEKVARVHGAHHPELARLHEAFCELRADMEPHFMKEERVLFPLIRQLSSEHAEPQQNITAGPISVMEQEHEHVGALMAEMHELTNGWQTPADGCASYKALMSGLAAFEADTHVHIHKENSILFPAALKLGIPIDQ